LRVIELPERVGGSDARNRGVETAEGEWIALLDDDDEWLPEKTEIQMALARNSSFRYPIVSSRLILRTSKGDRICPGHIPSSPICEYLFVRSPDYGDGFISTITLLFPKELYQMVPFKSGLPRNQDFDWVLRATRQESAGLEFAPQPLAIWHRAERRKSVSTTANWQGSYEWIRSIRDTITPRAYASFITLHIGWQAAAQQAWGSFIPLLREARSKGELKPADLVRYTGFWLVPTSVRSTFKTILSGATQ
jgi:glycosyltransferase involved in cell wall biosynthesis